MQIVLFRHGIAEDREAFAAGGRPDSERPLTARGGQRTRQAASGMLCLLPEAVVVAASPYVRARGTADIVAEVYGAAGQAPERDTIDDLQPGGRPANVRRWLEARAPDGAVVLVGHEPDLSNLMAWFVAGEPAGFARFKKAGACLVEFGSGPRRGEGELVWFLPPAVLRRLA